MKRFEKEATVTEMHEEFSQLKSAVLLDYQGLNVAEVTNLRRKLREVSVDFRIIKNTLSKRAAAGTSLENVTSYFKGPTAAMTSKHDPVAGFKILREFIRDNPKLEYKVAVIEGFVIAKDNIEKYAELPSREVLLAAFLRTMQAPVASFVRVFAGQISGLINVLNGIKKSKA